MPGAGSSRVTHPFAAPYREGLPPLSRSLDLHVLSAPPAFVLSQDQTLRRELKRGALLGSNLAVLVKSQGPRGFPRDPGSDQTRPKKSRLRLFRIYVSAATAKLTNDKFVELGSRSIGFLLRTRCLVLKEHHLTVLLTRPGPLRPDRVWAQKNRRHQASGQSDPASRRKVLVFGSPSVQFSEVFTHVGMRPWAPLSYIRLYALSNRRERRHSRPKHFRRAGRSFAGPPAGPALPVRRRPTPPLQPGCRRAGRLPG